MYVLINSTKFKRDAKKFKHNKEVLEELRMVLKTLKQGGVNLLPNSYLAHPLKGNWKGYYECHLIPDVLLIWSQNDTEMIIKLARLGSHSELF